TQYPMYNHEIVPTMYANFTLYHARDGKRHVRSYYDLLREIAKLNGTNLSTILANMRPRDESNYPSTGPVSVNPQSSRGKFRRRGTLHHFRNPQRQISTQVPCTPCRGRSSLPQRLD